jgi:apolipoprotein N-acyltransferase
VNISNDGWFDGTEEHEQHLAICRFRAVEARRAIVRAVNMGVSGVIDPDGRVVALPDPDWRKSKKVDAIVTAAVPLDARGSTYAAWGDWVPAGCWLVALAAPRSGWCGGSA